jgi:CHASE3 domain sensor protein
MTSLRPFYPAQTVSGETYIVDSRSGKVIRTVAQSFDTTERWRMAQRLANQLNAAHVQAVHESRRLGCALGLILAIGVLVLWLVTGGLSDAFVQAINAAL